MRQKLITASVLLIGTVVVIWSLSQPRYDINRVDPSLRGLSTPYESVNVGMNGFRGDIWMRILDRDGRQLRLVLPASIKAGTGKTQYVRLVVGTERVGDPNGREAPLSDDTRKLLIATVDRYRRFSDATDFVLIALRGAPGDYVSAYGRWIFGSRKKAVR